MMFHSETVGSYDAHAEDFSDYFRGIGSRSDDIARAIALSPKGHAAHILEIGCGDGRDAGEIIPAVSSYIGIDPSRGLLRIAKKSLPDADFRLGDASMIGTFSDIDIIFAFASLLHISQEELRLVFRHVYASLSEGGLIYMSLKERPQYQEVLQEDMFGKRLFYYYSVPLLEQLAGVGFRNAYEAHVTIGHTDWLTLALQKT